MINIKDYSKEQLLEELDRREKSDALIRPQLDDIKEIHNKLDKFAINFDRWFTHSIDDRQRYPKDSTYLILEQVIKLLYDDHQEYYKWFNANLGELE